VQIRYTNSAADLTPEQLSGFFEGWPNLPSPETHLRLLQNSDYVWLAIDEETDRVVGFITAISDGVLSAYIPLLEVLPLFRGHGIGKQLTRRMLETLHGFYMVDLICDTELQLFYEKLNMQKTTGMSLRNYARQSGS
jgi:ribosomal protein S18 acetylase RimI-like enzyme